MPQILMSLIWGSIVEWGRVFPLFHWSFIPWDFYLVLAVAFGFMLHCKKRQTATIFSATTPLMAEIIVTLFGIDISRRAATIMILLITCIIYTYAVLHGFKGISFGKNVYVFVIWTSGIYFLLGGQTRFILEFRIQSLGKMVQHFLNLVHILIL